MTATVAMVLYCCCLTIVTAINAFRLESMEHTLRELQAELKHDREAGTVDYRLQLFRAARGEFKT